LPATTQPPLLETAEALLTPGEVARLFRVDPKTVARWDKEGKLTSVKTLGGHRRYPQTQISTMLDAHPADVKVISALEGVHALAVDTGDLSAAAHITQLIDTLRDLES